MRKTFRFTLVFLAACAAASVNAGVFINEIYRNPEDLVDGDDGVGREFFELISDTGGSESLTGLTLVEISGQDFVGSEKTGTITQAINLDNRSTGGNGLFLWRDTADLLLPNPDAQTPVNVSIFTPHLFDDNVTYALVDGFAGSVGDDLDPNSDGVLDSTPWGSVADSIGVQESGEPGFSYAGQLGGVEFNALGFGNDAFARLPGIGQWFVFDSGSGEEDPAYFGPFYANDPGDNLLEDGRSFNFGEDSTFYSLTPGTTNAMVPEPAAVTSMLAAGLCLLGLRRRR